MKPSRPASAAVRRRRLVLAVLVAATIAALAFVIKPHGGDSTDASTAEAPTSATSSAVSPPVDQAAPHPGSQGQQRQTAPSATAQDGPGELPPLDERGDQNSRVTVFDETSPSIANLDPDLRAAFRRAAQAARKDNVTFYVTSGWRSATHQQELLTRAIAEYGSETEARKWVATPETSPHVKGDAVDIGHDAAIAWLSQHGASYDLCQIYRNEPWHYELRAGAAGNGCPVMYADPTHDPRMQR